MKRFYFMWSFLLLLMCMIGITSCHDYAHKLLPDYGKDSVYVAEQIEAWCNPSFTSKQEVLVFKKNLSKEYAIEKKLCELPENVLSNVATVLLKKKPSITKADIIDEYELNKDVYDNLESAPKEGLSKSTKEEKPDSGGEEQLLYTSFFYRVDTIDGVPVKVKVKEEKYAAK